MPPAAAVENLKEPPYFGTERFDCTDMCLTIAPGLKANWSPHPSESLWRDCTMCMSDTHGTHTNTSLWLFAKLNIQPSCKNPFI